MVVCLFFRQGRVGNTALLNIVGGLGALGFATWDGDPKVLLMNQFFNIFSHVPFWPIIHRLSASTQYFVWPMPP